MILSEADARALTSKVLALAKADSTLVSLSGSEGLNIRYAQNMATTSGSPSDLSLSVTANFGLRSGSASTTTLTDAGLAAVVAAAEKIAKIAPENPEFMPPLGAQTYPKNTGFAPSTASLTSPRLADRIQPILKQAEEQKLQASGYLQTSVAFTAFATSAGLFVYDTTTDVEHTVTARTPDGTGAGWAGIGLEDINLLDAAGQGSIAMDKAVRSQKPQALKPGLYTVILEPAAVSDLVGMMMYSFDQRAADEGRCFATKKGGGSRVGEQVFGKNITIYSDPNDPIAPGQIFSDDGLPAARTLWVENGILKNLQCSRYWAKNNNRTAVPSPTSLVLAGGTTTVPEMISRIELGLWITRIWYIREVDPQTVLLTGLTRDSVFLIEKGKVTKPSQNFRFNQSPVDMLNHVVAMGPSVRTIGSEPGTSSLCVPPLLIEKFNLTSISDAV